MRFCHTWEFDQKRVAQCSLINAVPLHYPHWNRARETRTPWLQRAQGGTPLKPPWISMNYVKTYCQNWGNHRKPFFIYIYILYIGGLHNPRGLHNISSANFAKPHSLRKAAVLTAGTRRYVDSRNFENDFKAKIELAIFSTRWFFPVRNRVQLGFT